jgi:uncharacterized membrane protein YkoI
VASRFDQAVMIVRRPGPRTGVSMLDSAHRAPHDLSTARSRSGPPEGLVTAELLRPFDEDSIMTPVTVPLALAAALALAGAASVAQTAPQRNDAAGKPTPSTLAQAIRMAEQETGGRARKAEVEDEHGVAAYEIKTVAKDKSAEVVVDPASGKVVRVDKPGFFETIVNLFDRDDRREDQAALAQLEGSPMTLAAAIDAAERETGGRAVKASLKSLYGQTLFKVGVLKDLAVQKVVVDPVSGKVTALAQREGKEDD